MDGTTGNSLHRFSPAFSPLSLIFLCQRVSNFTLLTSTVIVDTNKRMWPLMVEEANG